MRTLARSDVVGLLLAAFLIVGGLLTILVPRDIVVEHLMMGKGASTVEYVTPEGARVYGAVAVSSGIALGALLVWGIRASRPRSGNATGRSMRRAQRRKTRV